MDLAELQELIYFISGIVAAIIGAYGTMKARGKIVYPAQKIEAGREKIASLMKGNNELQQLSAIVGNVSSDELNEMFETAAGYAEGGYTVLEATNLGVMFIESIKEK